MASHSSVVQCCMCCQVAYWCIPPATLASTSMPPSSATVVSIAPWASASSRRSATTGIARAPVSESDAATASARSASTSTTATAAPAAERMRVVASPIPRPPPAIIATLSASKGTSGDQPDHGVPSVKFIGLRLPSGTAS